MVIIQTLTKLLANKKIIAQGAPKDLVKDESAKNYYFGDAFNIN